VNVWGLVIAALRCCLADREHASFLNEERQRSRVTHK